MYQIAVLTLTLVVGIAVGALAQGGGLRHLNPSTLSTPAGYTHVVVPSPGGRLVFIAGQVSADKSGAVVGKGDFRAQAKQVFDNLKLAVEAAGGGITDIAKINIYVTHMSQINTIREVRQQYFKDNPPASTLVQVVNLARPEYMLEIEAIAVVK
jgi:enamine deaminase RidA (YjgF/YER057c/UK114 family)